ncbi:CoA-binding protein [Clostridium sp. A1-XYC3]|uniref:CoA-binding protein n=1 Tax=Clostridium tanneri TaxID=3037988 RepID=A0ABU4JXC3_9CLOT|nr:CoA-binding protein [Clostridium sp. A1-XYC3]MDW8802807.1 CoA-binding protein [Clostridium sp. A1-XYC3]
MEARALLNYENWVVVGDVLNSTKYAYKILSSLKESNFNVSGVNPRDNSGNVYKDLKEVPYKIDVIDLCINPITGLKIVESAIELGINKILIQPGAESNDILMLCREKGIAAIQGCALIELSNYKSR